MRTILLSLVIVGGLVLSGCVGSGGNKSADDPATGPTVGADTPGAAVAGHVVDAALTPIQGAQVALLDPSTKAPTYQDQTNEEGAFDFGRVPEGSWVLAASAMGYNSASRNLRVVADEPQTELKVSLEPIPVSEPYMETQIQALTIQYGVAWQVGGDFNDGCVVPGVTCQGLAFPGADAQFAVDDPEGAPLQTIVLEEVWTPNSAVCAKAIAIDLYNPDAPSTQSPDLANPHYWTNYPSQKWSSQSPVVMTIPRSEDGNTDAIDDPGRIEKNGGEPLQANGNWTVRNFPPGKGLTNLPADANCFTDQKFDIYWSAFYLTPAPAGFSARPDA